MADEQPTDYSQVYDFLYRIERRIGYLEKDASFIEKKIASLDNNRSKHYKELSDDLATSHNDLNALKTHLALCAHGMARLGKDLKNTIKKDQVTDLNTQLDEIKFEEYVTRKDLVRGL
jgi:hypothetical protein